MFWPERLLVQSVAAVPAEAWPAVPAPGRVSRSTEMIECGVTAPHLGNKYSATNLLLNMLKNC